MSILKIVTLGAVLLFCLPALALAQTPKLLEPGFHEERQLSSSDNYAYSVQLSDGGAVLGEADQHGVDLVVDVFGPDGNLIRTIDTPNGTEGPEPIDVTATATGQYKLVIHTLEKTAQPGKYVMKIDRVLSAADNALRMAKQNYPLALQDLWKESVADPTALDRFIVSRKGNGPIVEDIPGDSKNVNVTYLYYGDGSAERAEVFGGVNGGSGGTPMQRFMATRLFFATEIVPKDALYRYGFRVAATRLAGPDKNIEIKEENNVPDSLNSVSFGGLSVLSLPNAPMQSYADRKDGVPAGKVTATHLVSKALGQDRPISIYLPPDYEKTGAVNLLIVFDGEIYDGSSASLIPTPTILDNLIATKKTDPTIAVFVNNIGQRNRDLGGNPAFADFIALELVPWVRQNYKVSNGPSHVVVAGSSRGGLASSHCAFSHPDVVGNVLSQSGAYWVQNDDHSGLPQPLSSDAGDLVLAFRQHRPLPIKIYLEVGRFDGLLGVNRELRDILRLKGYSVTYHEFDGGHDYLAWRNSLADGLTALIGRN